MDNQWHGNELLWTRSRLAWVDAACVWFTMLSPTWKSEFQNSGYGQSANGRRWALFSMHDLLHDQSSYPPSSAFALGAKPGFDMASDKPGYVTWVSGFGPGSHRCTSRAFLIVCCPICTAIQYQYVLSLSSHICTSSYHMSQVAVYGIVSNHISYHMINISYCMLNG